ncbi:NAD(P)-linked oxidoreductase [Glarea lozoyensis ATCC 20868]|uniref:NAD(P)-linked oxidoreductase n=1 Tax=Glarea lozoyensis (strain ATCC 20868 / MF5171) TaxID=1116229 RepID=S3CYQ0_GLAL2|nr:NAD(P)-linked oxidoreductase [Glarea lozoyensis ATCC 20868]EPE30084.1 NAD(P)-linked oxidoreductase [Glarea lozoyensis ATCC 20868]
MSSQTTLTSTLPLNNTIPIPRLHLGVYQVSGRACSSAVTFALEAGYRAIDSAEWYGNEKEVGDSINAFLEKHGEVKREDVWFTTKLQNNVGYEDTRRKIKASVKRCGLGYVDLYLLHSPIGGTRKRLECWRAVGDAIEEGEVRAGGVSNFGVRHLQELLDSNPKVKPAVNQIEVHPFNTQTAITDLCKKNDIIVEAYAPLARAMRAKHPKVVELSKKYNCTWAQLLIKWSLQNGFVPLPKSVKQERVVSNADVDGFSIEEADLQALRALDEHLVTDWDPTDVD